MKEGKRRDCFCNLSKDGFWMRFWTSHKSAVTRFMESFWRVLTVELFASSFGSAVRCSVHYAPTYAFAPLCPCPLVPVKINFVLPPFPSMAMEVFRCARQECISITGSVCRLVRPSLCLYVTQVLRPRFLAVFGHNKILYWIKWSTNRFWEPPLLLLSFHLSVCPSVYPYMSHDQYTKRHSRGRRCPIRNVLFMLHFSEKIRTGIFSKMMKFHNTMIIWTIFTDFQIDICNISILSRIQLFDSFSCRT